MQTAIIVLAVYTLLSLCAGTYVSVQKGRSEFEGAILGLLFGPVGVLVAACMPDKR